MKRYFKNQPIGVFDEQGNEVKEGDIVNAIWIRSTLQQEKVYEVKYEPDEASFVFEDVEDGEQFSALNINVIKII